MNKALVFEASREGYGIDQIRNVVTVGELKAMLADMDDDMMFVLSHDNGYTYGSISRVASIREEAEGEYGTEYNEIDEAWIY